MYDDTILEKAEDSKGTIKRLWKYLKKYKLKLIFVGIAILVYIGFSTGASLLLTPIIDNFVSPMIKEGSTSYLPGLIKYIVFFLSLTLGGAIFNLIQYKIVLKVAQDAVKNMRSDLFDKLEILPVSYYDTNHHGKLMSSITNDIDNVGYALSQSIDSIFTAAVNLVVNLVVMIVISPTLSVISIITVPILFMVSMLIMNLTKKQFAIQQESLANLNGYVEEYVSGQKVIKAFNKEKKILKEFDKYNETLRKDGFKANAYSSIVWPVMGSLNSISLAITYIFAGIMAINGRITIGKITTYSKFARQFSEPINEISGQIPTIQAAIAGAERVFKIIDEPEEFPDNKTKKSLENVKGEVELKNVSFGYDDELVLKNINLHVLPGETIAIVGPTGAGKTTIINLLTRFYDVNKGEILIDGVNIKDVNLDSLRESLGIVLQDTVLFFDTVRENIRFGNLEASDEEVEEAAKTANAYSFIRKLPERFDTVLNEDTTNLSVGQKQLLNIARVVINDPKILILDEATSNVDTRTEKKINEAMSKLQEDRTCFVIAHRLSTIRNADRIVVIDNGKIIEIGNHEELLKEKGMYYKMYTGMFSEEN